MRRKASGRTVMRGVPVVVAVSTLLAFTVGVVSPAAAEDFGYDVEYTDYDMGYDIAEMEPMPGENGAVAVEDPTASVSFSVEVVATMEPEAVAAAEQARLTALADAPAPLLKEAQAAAIIDGAGNVLYEKDANRAMSPASITKVMTAVVALDSLKNGKSMDDVVTLVAPDLGPDAQMADYAAGEKATFRDLLRVMLVYSANDAAYNVALHVAGSIPAFADLMNAKAAEIGLTNSHFKNPHGIDEDGHLVSALDLARLSRYSMQNYPFIAQTVSCDAIEIPIHGEPVVFRSTDALLGLYTGIRGVKTGYAEAFTFMGASGRGNVSLYSAVLGCTTASGRFNDTAAMMDWAYAKFSERDMSEDAWAVRVNPYALDLGYRTVISATSDAKGTVWPGGGAASYESALARPGRLLDAGTAYGWSQWAQGGRDMGTTTYATREIPVRVSAWPTFSLPLFESTTTLGSVVADA